MAGSGSSSRLESGIIAAIIGLPVLPGRWLGLLRPG